MSVHTVRRTIRESGFTLIELLVVIAIIGILASVVLASVNTARLKGRDAKRVSDIKELQLALELYFDGYSSYPSGTSLAAISSALTTNGYISVIPTDPSGGTAAYGYLALPSGCAAGACTSYLLAAQLESSGNSAMSSNYTGDSTHTITVNGNSVKCDGNTANLFCVTP